MEETKGKIIQCTIQLMMETGNLEKITMRDIASRAGIGLGAVNYHFQSKNNLINISVRQFLSSVISSWEENSELKEEDAPVDKIYKLLLSLSDFLAEYKRVARISILFDLQFPHYLDNTSQTIETLIPFVAALGEECNAENRALSWIASIQHFFLRSYNHDETPGFFNRKDRESFIKNLVAQVQ